MFAAVAAADAAVKPAAFKSNGCSLPHAAHPSSSRRFPHYFLLKF